MLGENTEAVLADWLGLDGAEIERLSGEGAFGHSRTGEAACPTTRRPCAWRSARRCWHARASEAQEFGSFFLSRLLGFEVSYTDETCTVRFEAVPTLFNPQGTLHGGIPATAMDISVGHLLHRSYGAGATLEMKVQYLSAVTAGHVRCEGNFLRRGRGISYLQSHAFDDGGGLVAHATATWKLRKPALEAR